MATGGQETKAIELTVGMILTIALIAIGIGITIWGATKTNQSWDKGSAAIESVSTTEHARYDNKLIKGGEIAPLLEKLKNTKDFAVTVKTGKGTKSYLSPVSAPTPPATDVYFATGSLDSTGTPGDIFGITDKFNEKYINPNGDFHSYLMQDINNGGIIGYYMVQE